MLKVFKIQKARECKEAMNHYFSQAQEIIGSTKQS